VAKQTDGLVSPFGRIEVIVDFSTAVGNVIMKNNAQTPLLVGDPVDPNLDGQIMEFVVTINPLNTVNGALTKIYNLGNPYPKFSKGTILPLMLI